MVPLSTLAPLPLAFPSAPLSFCPSVPACSIVYPSYRGYLKKKGGGTSIFGRKSWKERFFVFSRGNLAYFESAADWEKGTEPLKALQISLRYYRVDP